MGWFRVPKVFTLLRIGSSGNKDLWPVCIRNDGNRTTCATWLLWAVGDGRALLSSPSERSVRVFEKESKNIHSSFEVSTTQTTLRLVCSVPRADELFSGATLNSCHERRHSATRENNIGISGKGDPSHLLVRGLTKRFVLLPNLQNLRRRCSSLFE